MALRMRLPRRPGRIVIVLTAAAMVAAVSPAAAPASLAQTAPSSPAPLNGPPAPASFAGDLMRIYDEITAAPPPPGVTSNPTVPNDLFHQAVSTMTPDQLNRIYDTTPTGWSQVISTIDAYAQGVAPNAAQVAAQPASTPPVPPAARPAAEGGAPAPPLVFAPTPCPGLAFPAHGGAYQQLYSLEVARSTVELSASELETIAVGLDALLEGETPELPEDFLLVVGTIIGKTVADVTAAVLDAVADAMELPIDTIEFLLHRAIDSCQYDNSVGEVPYVDANEVATQNNVNASYGLGQKNFKLDQAINQLLDDRTQKIVGQLNTAQASLDQNLKHSIELALSGGNPTTIVSYELPASLGGYLNSTPIGVQAIVTSALSAMQTANQPVSPQASKNLVLANNALAAGQFKQAFVYYQTTYGLVVR
jgi:hypothetical protein